MSKGLGKGGEGKGEKEPWIDTSMGEGEVGWEKRPCIGTSIVCWEKLGEGRGRGRKSPRLICLWCIRGREGGKTLA